MKKTPLIKTCFFRSEKGKCGDPEIYRFNPHVEKTGRCAFNPDSPAFMDGKLLCEDFRPDRRDKDEVVRGVDFIRVEMELVSWHPANLAKIKEIIVSALATIEVDVNLNGEQYESKITLEDA